MNEKEIKEKLTKVIEILSAPQDSDEIWFCVGELETIVREISSEKEDNYNQGARDVLSELSSLYEGIKDTDIWSQFYEEGEE